MILTRRLLREHSLQPRFTAETVRERARERRAVSHPSLNDQESGIRLLHVGPHVLRQWKQLPTCTDNETQRNKRREGRDAAPPSSQELAHSQKRELS